MEKRAFQIQNRDNTVAGGRRLIQSAPMYSIPRFFKATCNFFGPGTRNVSRQERNVSLSRGRGLYG